MLWVQSVYWKTENKNNGDILDTNKLFVDMIRFEEKYNTNDKDLKSFVWKNASQKLCKFDDQILVYFCFFTLVST